jgi:hypothetical protein
MNDSKLHDLIALNDLQFIKKVQSVHVKSDDRSIALWNVLLGEMDKRRHNMYKERDLCKSYDEYKNNDLIDLYEEVEENMRNKRNEILTKPKGKKEKQISDAEYLELIREYIEDTCNQGGTSFWKVVDGELYEIDSAEYDKLIESGQYRVFKYV